MYRVQPHAPIMGIRCPRLAQAAHTGPAHVHACGTRKAAPVVSLTSRAPRREAEMRTVMLLPPVA